jgi:hypothetical protein
MKSKMKRQGSNELPRFAVGALAIAGASAASGATVQITFANNVMSTSAGLTLFEADLSGDGAADVRGLSSDGTFVELNSLDSVRIASAMLINNGTNAIHNLMGVGGGGSGLSRGLVGFNFSDNGMNGGLVTAGWLDVSASATTASGASIQIHRLIFDDASTTAPTGLTSASTGIPEWQVSAVPEPGSNLALLALGAGGLTLRRRLKRAA